MTGCRADPKTLSYTAHKRPNRGTPAQAHPAQAARPTRPRPPVQPGPGLTVKERGHQKLAHRTTVHLLTQDRVQAWRLQEAFPGRLSVEGQGGVHWTPQHGGPRRRPKDPSVWRAQEASPGPLSVEGPGWICHNLQSGTI
ncbi:unnamed protein product [Boreogadus saida]